MKEDKQIEVNDELEQDSRLDEEMEFVTLYDYLQSPEGHEIASRIVEIVEDTKAATIDKRYIQSKFNRWMDAGFIIIVSSVIIVLSVTNKLNLTIGLFLGIVIGYFFGRSK